MKKIDLQLFGTAIKGKKIIYLYRVLSSAASSAAAALAFTTENSRTKSKDSDSTETKDGTIRTPGATEVEITATSYLETGDTLISSLESAMDSDSLIEIWEVNLEEEGTGDNKFKATYYQGYLTEFEKTSNAEDFVECSLTFSVNGSGVSGEATVTAAQQAAANYTFTDTTATGA